jgi:hypothetical protein
MLPKILDDGLLEHRNARLGHVVWIHGFPFRLVGRL